MNKINILLIATSLSTVLDQATYLAKQNNVYVVFIFAGTRKKDIEINKFPPNLLLYQVRTPSNLKSLVEASSSIIFLKKFPSFLITMFCFLNVINKIMQNNNIDIINAHWAIPAGFFSCLSMYFPLIRSKKRIPIITTVRGSDIKIFSKKIFFKHLIIFTLNYSNLIVALSSDLKHSIIDLDIDRDKIVVIPYGVNLKKFQQMDMIDSRIKLNMPLDKFIFLFVGRLVKIKRVDELIRMMLLFKNDPLFMLIIIGFGPEELYLKSIVLENSLNNVSFIGMIDNEMISSYMNASNVLVLYSSSEGLPTVIQEALACGLPVVSNNVGGIVDLIKDGKNGFIIDNIIEMKEKIILLSENNAIYNNLKINALKFAQKYLDQEKTFPLVEEINQLFISE